MFNSRFTYFDIGAEGRNSDGGIFAGCGFNNALESKTLNIPPPRLLPHSDKLLPHVLLGDEAFPLKTNIMRPYPGRRGGNEVTPERVYNYRLSRARRVIENAFGIFVARWRVFANKLTIQPEKVKTVAKACIALHNFCSIHHQRADITLDNDNAPGSWRKLRHDGLQNPFEDDGIDSEAEAARSQFKDYFSNEGAVEWQNQAVMM